MADQAQALRDIMDRYTGRSSSPKTRVVTITSGKGGVGKSNFSLNFALALEKRGLKVVLLDADFGLANIDVLMGSSAPYHLHHLITREKTVWEVMNRGANGLEYIAGGSGVYDLLRMNEEEISYFVSQIQQLNGYADYLLIDTGAGLSKETARLISSSDETIVVTTPEPTAIADAYALMKMVYVTERYRNFRLVVNRVTDDREGVQTADKLDRVASSFLGFSIPFLGSLPDDPEVGRAVKKQVPFTIDSPRSPASRSLFQLAGRYAAAPAGASGTAPAEAAGGLKSFLSRFISKAFFGAQSRRSDRD
ncbi:MinD/ParA family protein [Paenibacillus thermoaerophilus]|uniref:MinD/ParA family protein n=1 Tax=Paenibacillus thermoaerophilus TaxID=1215385 RepID=A0ABW2V2W7_9BACL|nr:MinD/ParA family protein [Paenibacillus thermoaerophilus]TMV13812.1 MinD/ParA family protein [Paenibacillus thermoaerophilus]